MRHHPRHTLLLFAAFVTWSTACVEPPSIISTPKDSTRDSGDDLSRDKAPDEEGDASLSSARILLGTPADPVIEINGYARAPLAIEVFDHDGKRVPSPELTISFSQKDAPIPTLGYTDGLLYSTEPGEGIISVTDNTRKITATKPYRIRPFAPKFDIPRIVRVPYTQAIDFAELLRVTEFDNQEMSLDAWFAQLNNTSGDAITLSFATKDPTGNEQRPLNDVVLSNVPKVRGYTLTVTSGKASLAVAALTFDITIITEEDTHLTAGLDHYCKLVKGTASCWGGNSNGQLGIGTLRDRISSTPVVPAIPFTQLDSTVAHTCGISNDRNAYCWGNDGDGRSSRTSSEPLFITAPMLVEPPSGPFNTNPLESQLGRVRFTQITTGQSHTCALSTRGVVYCWGNDTRGQLGFSDTWTKANIPMDRTFPPIELAPEDYGVRFQHISAGFYHTCALSFDNELFCWGDNQRFQILPGDTRETLLPVRIPPPEEGLSYTDVWTGPTNTCARTSEGAVYCWGDNFNRRTSIDDESKGIFRLTSMRQLTAYFAKDADASTPEILDLELGQFHSCALSRPATSPPGEDSTSLHCWGLGLSGELGLGDHPLTAQNKATDLPQSGLHTDRDAVISDIGRDRKLDLALLSNSTCLIDQHNARVSCWGSRARGVHGDNTNALQAPPATQASYTRISNYSTTLIDGATPATLIKPALTLESTCLLVPIAGSSGQLKPTCWGSTLYGQSGDGNLSIRSPFNPSTQVSGNFSSSPTGLSASIYQACTVQQDDAKKQMCWGQNRSSVEAAKILTKENEPFLGVPHEFASPHAATDIAMSRYNTCSWHRQNAAAPPVCRGANRRGALGNAHEADFQDDWSGLDDNNGRIGHYILENRFFGDGFDDKNNEDTIVELAMGEQTGCMIRKSPESQGMHTYALWCWGNIMASLGIEYADAGTPYAVQKLWETTRSRDPLSLAMGDRFGCLVDADGVLQCWGNVPLTDMNNPSGARQTPTPLLTAHLFSEVQIAGNTACLRHATMDTTTGITPQHALTCFGHNGEGQAGQVDADGITSRGFLRDPFTTAGELETVPLGGLAEIYQFIVGVQHACVTGRFADTPADAIELACWGLDTHGQSSRHILAELDGLVHTAALPPETTSSP